MTPFRSYTPKIPNPVPLANARFFVVGGCVRDFIMGKPHQDVDIVVTGATEEAMIAAGLKPVGNAFPVFLNGEGQEFALARRETKTGNGYLGFATETRGVTLEEDLARRDITMNAIAVDLLTDEIVDPFGGVEDIRNKVIRATTPNAFVEDPVRVLRVARFAARFPDFSVDECTMELCRKVRKEDFDAVPGERLKLEFEKAWEQSSSVPTFFGVLHQTGVLEILFPEIEALREVVEPIEHHPEGDTFSHTMLALNRLQDMGGTVDEFWAVLTHDFGKVKTATTVQHFDHDKDGLPIVEGFAERMKLTKRQTILARTMAREHMRVKKILKMRPGKVEALLRSLRVEQNPSLFFSLVRSAVADSRGRLGLHDMAVPFAEVAESLVDAFKRVRGEDVRKMIEEGGGDPEDGIAMANRMRQERIRAIKMVLTDARREDAVA